MIVKVKTEAMKSATKKLTDPFNDELWILVHGSTLQLIGQDRNGNTYSVVEHNALLENTQVLLANTEDIEIKEETEDIMVLKFPS
jgi:hypothetical protein